MTEPGTNNQPARYDLDAVQALMDERAWDAAGVTGDEGIRICWAAGFDSTTVGEWLSTALYVLSDGVEDADVPLPDLVAAAQAWKVADFSTEEARAWRRVLTNYEDRVDLVHEARRWRAAGFDPERAGPWRQWGVLDAEQDLEFAVLFANQDWHPMSAALLSILLSRYPFEERDRRRREWLALDLGAEKTLNYVKAGVTRDQAVAFETLDLQSDTLEAELQARYDRLPPLDPFYAMHLNHICYGHGGWDAKDEDLPFYARHIRDLHDEYEREQAEADEWQAHANSAGQRLVAVVEVGDNVSEDTDAQAVFTARQSAIKAAVEAGHGRRELTVTPEKVAYHCIATAPDGRGYVAVIRVVGGSGFPGRRKPTPAEVEAWARKAPC